jgi:hypothetical protein
MKSPLLLLSLAILLVSNAFGQSNTVTIDHADILLESSNFNALSNFTEDDLEDLDQSVLDSLLANQSFTVTTSLDVSTIDSTQTIHIKLGRTVGGTDIIQTSIPIQGTSLPTGVTALLIEDNNIQIEFGDHLQVQPIHLEVWLTDANGTNTSVYTVSK